MKPRIAPYRRHDRPGKWICYSPAVAGARTHYQGTGYSPLEAYARWLSAVKCTRFEVRNGRIQQPDLLFA